MIELPARQARALMSEALTGTADSQQAHLYTAAGFRAALVAETSVVTGAMGAGKTFWSTALADTASRHLIARSYRLPRLTRTRVVAGHTAGGERSGIQPATVAGLISAGVRPLHLWTAVLLTAVGAPEAAGYPTWAERCNWVAADPGALQRFATSCAEQDQGDVLVLFDGLEMLHTDRAAVEGHLRALLELDGALADAPAGRQHCSRVRLKVFVQPDVLAGLGTSREPSRRAPRTAELSWGRDRYAPDRWVALYGLAFELLGNHPGASGSAFRALHPGWELDQDGKFTAPSALRSDPGAQRTLFDQLADPHVDGSPRRGNLYDWLPGRLQDAVGRVSPRSFLAALAAAAEQTANTLPGHERAIHHTAGRAAVIAGARVRADELARTAPWIHDALAPLEGLQVPLVPDAVFDRWRQTTLLGKPSAHGAPVGPRNAGGDALLDELVAAGAMYRRANGQIDLPDVLRLFHGLGRRGGVAVRTAVREAAAAH